MTQPPPQLGRDRKPRGRRRYLSEAVELHPEEVEPGPLPRWFWWLPVLALAAWWPVGSFWASDDYFAVHYAQDLSRALQDFVGPQYDAADKFLFYRPLVTLSLWLETAIGGGAPFVSHLSNAVVLALGALLAGLLWRRVVDDETALLAGLLWAVAGSHLGAVCWAVGRTDLQSTLWILLSLLWFVRWTENRHRTRALSLLAMVLGLMTKETAMALPGLIAVCAFARAEGALPRRVTRAVAWTWPYVMVLAAYLLFRLIVLGTFGGGYLGAGFDAANAARGLGTIVLDLVNPWRWCQATWLEPWLGRAVVHDVMPVVGYLPAVLAAGWIALRPHRLLAAVAVLLLAGCALLPYAPFFTGADNHHNLRYYGLALVALAGLLATPGVLFALVAIVLFVPVTVELRLQQHATDHASSEMHERLLQQRQNGVPEPWFVHGLPHANAQGTALMFHFGVDRLLQPPFGPGDIRVYAHRPMADLPTARQLVDLEGLPIAPPLGTTMTFDGPGLLVTVPQRRLPALPVEFDGGTDLTGDALLRMAGGEKTITLRTPGVSVPALRVTFFTPMGYMSVLADATSVGPGGSALDMVAFFRDGWWTTNRTQNVLIDLTVATVLDLSTEYPVLVEGGTREDDLFTPTHRARAMPVLRFDRDLGAVVREIQSH